MKFSDFFYSKQNRNIIFWLAWTLPLHWGILFLNSFAAFVFVLLATAFSIPDIIQEIVVTILSTVLFPFRWGLFSAVIGVPFTVGTMLLLYASFPLGLLTKIPKSKNSNQAQNGLDSNQYSYILRYISYLNLVVSVLLMGFDLANYPESMNSRMNTMATGFLDTDKSSTATFWWKYRIFFQSAFHGFFGFSLFQYLAKKEMRKISKIE